jgi:hypothetical protein
MRLTRMLARAASHGHWSVATSLWQSKTTKHQWEKSRVAQHHHKAAKPRENPYKLTDERGLFLIVTPGGGKWWRFGFRFDGREKSLSLGAYPDVS